MSGLKLITEVTMDAWTPLVEEVNGRKNLYVEGPYISVNTPNRNNRIYSKSMMEPIVENYIQEKVSKGSAFGEFGHPNGPKINEERLSHRITSLKWDGNSVIGKAVVLDESNLGKIMKNIIETGGRLGMSTRGMGSVVTNSTGLQEVQKDFKLVTVDAVTDPSGAGCWVNGIMEGVEWVYDATRNTFMENRIEQMVETVKNMSREEREERMQRLFEHYLAGISKAKN